MKNKQHLDIEITANILKLLGDKTRLTMIKMMFEHDECCVCEFVNLFDISQPAISQHLRKLKDSGLVKESRKGQWIYYSLNQDFPYYTFVEMLIRDLPPQTLEKRNGCD